MYKHLVSCPLYFSLTLYRCMNISWVVHFTSLSLSTDVWTSRELSTLLLSHSLQMYKHLVSCPLYFSLTLYRCMNISWVVHFTSLALSTDVWTSCELSTLLLLHSLQMYEHLVSCPLYFSLTLYRCMNISWVAHFTSLALSTDVWTSCELSTLLLSHSLQMYEHLMSCPLYFSRTLYRCMNILWVVHFTSLALSTDVWTSCELSTLLLSHSLQMYEHLMSCPLYFSLTLYRCMNISWVAHFTSLALSTDVWTSCELSTLLLSHSLQMYEHLVSCPLYFSLTLYICMNISWVVHFTSLSLSTYVWTSRELSTLLLSHSLHMYEHLVSCPLYFSHPLYRCMNISWVVHFTSLSLSTYVWTSRELSTLLLSPSLQVYEHLVSCPLYFSLTLYICMNISWVVHFTSLSCSKDVWTSRQLSTLLLSHALKMYEHLVSCPLYFSLTLYRCMNISWVVHFTSVALSTDVWTSCELSTLLLSHSLQMYEHLVSCPFYLYRTLYRCMNILWVVHLLLSHSLQMYEHLVSCPFYLYRTLYRCMNILWVVHFTSLSLSTDVWTSRELPTLFLSHSLHMYEHLVSCPLYFSPTLYRCMNISWVVHFTTLALFTDVWTSRELSTSSQGGINHAVVKHIYYLCSNIYSCLWSGINVSSFVNWGNVEWKNLSKLHNNSIGVRLRHITFAAVACFVACHMTMMFPETHVSSTDWDHATDSKLLGEGFEGI